MGKSNTTLPNSSKDLLMDAQEVYTILLFVQCRLSIAYFVFPLLQPTQNQLFKKKSVNNKYLSTAMSPKRCQVYQSLAKWTNTPVSH
jgi:hypothetical protein